MVFSSDNSILAVAPRAESGSLAAEIQFYATEEKAKPTVAKLKQGGLSHIDFLDSGASGEAGDLVVTCGLELCQLSPSTGSIVSSWTGEKEKLAFRACTAVGRHEVVTLAEKTVQLWDLRTAAGLARSEDASQVLTALDAGPLSTSSTALLGDEKGGLHRLDWRAAAPGVESLWHPAEDQIAPALRVFKRSGMVCLLAGASLKLLTLDPCVVQLGSAGISGRLGAIAAFPAGWALATSDPRTSQWAVAIVDSGGNYLYQQYQKELLEQRAQKAENEKKQKEKKKESQGKKPSSGKAAHGRNSGR
eukprot:TRINITY_DN79398_c0_g1_i1.p1 TRINITY_DN79398_c0_g1~~TRINITY_DN79398_c0_g1_i1.p1  ORF type:complete len:326 (+),score=70.17 TRINITY_DN79398_c0_g1_i1:68-979(+)